MVKHSHSSLASLQRRSWSSVSDEPLRTDAPMVAALTALEGKPLDLGKLRKVLAIGPPLRGESFWDRWDTAFEDRHTEEDLRRSFRELRHHQTLDYVLMLLCYWAPVRLPPGRNAEVSVGPR